MPSKKRGRQPGNWLFQNAQTAALTPVFSACFDLSFNHAGQSQKVNLHTCLLLLNLTFYALLFVTLNNCHFNFILIEILKHWWILDTSQYNKHFPALTASN